METTGPEPVIERASPRDFLAVAALDREAWRESANGEFIPDGEHVWRIWTEHALVFVARLEDAVVGAVLAFPCVSGTYCVHKVFVSKAVRGRRLGGALMAALLAEIDCAGARSFLTVDPANERAIRLYTHWGFTERVFVSGFYRATEDRFVLSRPAQQHGTDQECDR